MNSGYYYLHTNGDIIWKNTEDPTDFDSTFVQKYWKNDVSDRSIALTIILESISLNASKSRIEELVKKWNMTFEDSLEFLKRVKPTETMRQGLKVFVKDYLGMSEKSYWTKVNEELQLSKV